MIRKIIVPVGWPCSVEECPPGPFVTMKNPELLCFMSEYAHEGSGPRRPMAFNSSGEFFHGEGMVQPVDMIEENHDD